ncbi:MAG: O-antigen ligase family protein [Methylophilaceae bacterium]
MSKSSTKLQSSSQATIIMVIFATLIAMVIGVFSAFFPTIVGERYGVLVGLPAAIIIGMLFLYDRYLFFMLVILFRSGMDVILDATKLGSFGLGAVLNALVILIGLLALIEFPKPSQKVFAQTWLFFLIIAFVSLFYAPDFIAGLKTFLALVSYAAVFVIAIVVVKSEQDYGKWMKCIFLSSIVPVAYSFVDMALGGFNNGHSEEGFRISSTFSHPNVFAFYLVLMISVGFYFYKSNVGYLSASFKRLIPLYLVLLLALLMLTKTRSAWAACFMFFTTYAIFYERKYLIWIFLSSLAALLIPDVRDRILSLAQGNEVINYSQLNSYAWRKLIWQDSFKWMTASHYPLGYGLESFKYYSAEFFSMANRHHAGAHSVYVQLFFETGLIGLLAFVWSHLRVAMLLLQFYKANKFMIFSALMFLVEFAAEAYSDNMLNYLTYNWYLWFVLGAAYSLSYHKKIRTDSDAANNAVP